MAESTIPQGWKQKGNTKVYEASIKTKFISGANIFINGEIDGASGNYKVYRQTGIPGVGDIYSVSPNGDVTVSDQNIYNQLKKSGEIDKLDGDIQKRVVEINRAVGTSQEKQELNNSKLYKPVSDRLNSQEGTNLDQKTARELTNISAKEGAEPRSSYKKGTNSGLYVYPTGLGKNGQDYIQFDIMQYESKNLTTFFYKKSDYQIKKSIGTICLPIQSQISDNNVVNWNEETMNAFEYGAAIASLNMMNGTSPAQITEELIDKVVSNTGLSGDLATAFRAYAARMAVSSQGNLLSRLGGAVINPNLELLFQGPLLRVFNFNFRLTPRSQSEADQVRYIIRAFKEASSVQRGTKDLFLKAPNVFNIKYVKGGTTDAHPSLNRIKTCALRSCVVDYTPGGSYSTFNDPNYTMTSYGLQLQFQELEPIYSDDYSTGEESGAGSPVPYNHIGY